MTEINDMLPGRLYISTKHGTCEIPHKAKSRTELEALMGAIQSAMGLKVPEIDPRKWAGILKRSKPK